MGRGGRGLKAWAPAALALTLSVAAWASQPLGRIEIGAPAPDFVALGSDGRQHHLADYAGKIVVLEWTSPVCPYTALKYRNGLMQALQRRALGEGVVWLSIDTAGVDRPGFLSPQAARARVAQTRARVSAFLFDVDGQIGRAYGARTTPSIYVIGTDGRLVYQGALDDHPGRKTLGGLNYVAATLDDLRSGRAVGTPETRPYGCPLEY